MNRIHSTLIALLIGAAATAGLYAAVHTVRLGQKASAPSISAREIASRTAKLAAWRRSLAAARAKRPPALPKLPHYAPVVASPPAPQQTPAAAAQPHVTYVQAPTVVKYKRASTSKSTTSSSWSDDSGGDDSGGDGGDAGGGD